MKKEEFIKQMNLLQNGWPPYKYGESKVKKIADAFKICSLEEFEKIVNIALDLRIQPQLPDLQKIASDIRISGVERFTTYKKSKKDRCVYCGDSSIVLARRNNPERFGIYNGTEVGFECGFCELGEDYQKRYEERDKTEPAFRFPKRKIIWGGISWKQLSEDYIFLGTKKDDDLIQIPLLRV